MKHVEPQQGAEARLWTGTFVAVLAAMHLFFLSFFGTFTALPLYLEGARDVEIGFVIGVQAVAATLVRPYSGRLVDRYGRRRFQVLGAALAGIGLAGHAVTADPFLLVPFRVTHGVAMALFTTASITMGADAAPVARRGEAMGYYTMVNNLAQLYGPWLGFFLATRVGFEAFFLAAGGAALAGAGMGLLARDVPRETFAGAPASSLISRAALLTTVIFLTMTTAYGSLQGFLALFAETSALGNPGLFFIALGAALTLLRVGSGVLSDRLGRGVVIVPGMALAGGAMILLASGVPAVFLSSAVLFGVGFAMGHTGLLALTVDRAGAAGRGAGLATFVLAWDIGTVLGTMGMGLVAGLGGYTAVFSVAAALPLLGLAIFLTTKPATSYPDAI